MGGLEVHIWELAKHLARNGHEVHLYGVKKYRGRVLPTTEVVDGFTVHRRGGTLALGRFELYEFAHLHIGLTMLFHHLRRPFSVVHAHTVYPPGIAAWILKIFTRVPFVVTSHGNEIMELPSHRIYRHVKVHLIRRFFRSASHVIGVSEELRLLSIHFGSDPARTTRLSNVIDVTRFVRHTRSKRDQRQVLGLPPGKDIVISLRRLSLKTGVQYLIKAAPEILRRRPETLFLVCGDGEFRPELESMVGLLGLQRSVMFRGSIDNSSVQEYLAAADVAVFPSLAEATSIACLEAMACGLPVVASNVGGLPEIITHGETGLLVDFGLHASTFRDPGLSDEVISRFAEAILTLLEDPALRLRVGSAAARYTHAHHSWVSYAETIQGIYEGIASWSGEGG
jgi:glycosyltransferase involved in cell wall biosynthesis